MKKLIIVKIIQFFKWLSVAAMLLFIVLKNIPDSPVVIIYPLIISLIFMFSTIEALILNKIYVGGFVIDKNKSITYYYLVIIIFTIVSIIFLLKSFIH